VVVRIIIGVVNIIIIFIIINNIIIIIIIIIIAMISTIATTTTLSPYDHASPRHQTSAACHPTSYRQSTATTQPPQPCSPSPQAPGGRKQKGFTVAILGVYDV